MSLSTASRPSTAKPRNERRAADIPGATYRLQFHAGFRFADAVKILPYLQRLGITHVYASPLFQATAGSTHGYDVCCHGCVSPELGGEEGFRMFAEAAREHGMGTLLDIVPNHMAASAANPWWWDVLKHGTRSRYAQWFDIDWESNTPSLRGKVLLPVLGARLGCVLGAGEIRLAEHRGERVVTYYDNHFPLAPETPQEWLDRVDNAKPDPGLMAAILDAQHYRLAYWRVGPQEINYRRFFDVTGLVAMRMERPEVFDASHEHVRAMMRAGLVHGLRIDHPDGLRDPAEYLERLRNLGTTEEEAAPYVVVEKILSGGEALPANWQTAGTTGYDFLIQLNAVFVARHNESAMTDVYREFTGCADSFEDLAYEGKKRVVEMSFVADVDRLATRLHAVAARTLAGRDFTWRELRGAIVEVLACMPVYRTYVTEHTTRLSAADAEVISEARADALRRCPALRDAIEYVASVLGSLDRVNREFVLRFQQVSGPAAAKGIEDTAFYRYFRLVSLNEVAGEPGHFGSTVEEFHQDNERRARDWPHSLLATATHDTKRGEDVRARINVLSEMPTEWRNTVRRWREWNARHKTPAAEFAMPDANDEYLIYQTLVGSWPEAAQRGDYSERIKQYVLKAVREAKRHTAWTETNEIYERAAQDFVQRILDAGNLEFLCDLDGFVNRLAFFGRLNSLSQTLLKLTCPGVPDTYQGSELWDLRLVDPDNRTPVDYALRERLLATADTVNANAIATRDPGAKLALIRTVLSFRNEHRALFDDGEYLRLLPHCSANPAPSHLSEHLVTFARRYEQEVVIVIAPRLVFTLLEGEEHLPIGPAVWRDLRIPSPGAGEWRDVLTGRSFSGASLPIADLLNDLPFALLHGHIR